YAETSGCRRRFLLGYFGEERAELCGACDTCRSGVAARVEAEREASGGDAGDWPVGAEVRHDSWGDGSVVSDDGDRITVHFAEAGYKTLAIEVVAASGVLQHR